MESKRAEKEVNESIKKKIINLKAKGAWLTILLIAVFFLTALSGTQFIEEVSAIDYNEYTGTLDDANWALRIPDPWNDMLVVCCRGYSHTPIADVRSSLPFSSMGPALLEQGFAVAASDYGVGGYCVPEGVNSTYQLTEYIIENYNVTGRVFLVGASMGGAVVLLLGEKYPKLYSGVLDVFGVKDTKEQYETKTIWAGLNDTELEAELTALTAPVPPFMFPSLEALRSFCNVSSADIASELGGTPEDEPEAYEDVSPLYNANISIPVITVHGTSDALVPYSQSVAYQEAVANAGRSSLYRLYSVVGGQHGSSDVAAELPAHFDELVEWSNYLTGVYDWPMRGHNSQRTAYSESPAPITNQTLWITDTPAMGNSPCVADDRVYIGAFDGTVFCYDAKTGAQIWNYTTGDEVRSSAAFASGRVYVGSNNNTFYCLDAATGAQIWNYTMDGWAGSSPTVIDGKVYTGSDDNCSYCFDAVTGALMWKFTTGGRVVSGPSVAGGLVYFGSVEDYNYYCLNATTGEKIWNFTTGGEAWTSPAVADGRVYVGSMDNNTYCLNATTGAQIWNYTNGGISFSSCAVADGSVYVCSLDGNVYCLNATSGGSVWNYTADSVPYGVPAVADGKVYATSLNGMVYCLNASTGALIWSYTTYAGIDYLYGCAVVANGVVYVPSGYLSSELIAIGDEYVVPESFAVEVVLLLSTIVAAVSFSVFRKRPKLKDSLLKKP